MVPNINQKIEKVTIPRSSLFTVNLKSNTVFVYMNVCKPMRKNIRFMDCCVFFTFCLICIVKAKCLF